MDLRDVDFDKETENYSRFEHAQKFAQENGLEVVVPKPNELFIDIDNLKDLEHFKWAMERLGQYYGLRAYEPTPSKSPNHFHIIVTTGEHLSVETKILLQALLGSDRRREALSLERVKIGMEYPTLFFEQKKESKDASTLPT